MDTKREPLELVRRGAGADAPAELYACAGCGHVYSPRIYACGVDEGRIHARKAAEDCISCRRENEHPDALVERSNEAQQRRAAKARRTTGLEHCFSLDGERFYADPAEAAEAGEMAVYAATFRPFSLDAGSVISSILSDHHEDADESDLEGLRELCKAIDNFNKTQTRGSYHMDDSQIQELTQSRTFAMIKPDATARGVEEDMIRDIEAAGFRVLERTRRKLEEDEARWLYREHAARSHYGDLVAYTVSGDVVLLLLEGDDDNVPAAFRKLMGATDHTKAAPGTLRAKYAVGYRENSIHGSDSPAAAIDEIQYFIA